MPRRQGMIHRLLAIVMLLAGLGLAQGAGDAERILKDLASRNYQVQRRAVLAARETKNPKLLERLLVLAKGDSKSHPNIRGYACETLGYYRDPRVFDVLAEAATKGPLSARGGAKRGLGRLGDARAQDLLTKSLDHRSTWSATADGLMLLGDKRAAKPLSRLLRAHAHDHFVHGRVAEAIVVLSQAADRPITDLESHACRPVHARRREGPRRLGSCHSGAFRAPRSPRPAERTPPRS